ncbi:hypothetical protein PG991_011707 [Apiospora marii]|uniref:Uncharacterized protein n=1 Tax=Apiospora marii TaxID=335849 RepID=A0ABR1RF27_9PEZI
MYRTSKHISLRRATGAHIQASNMPLSKTHEAHHIDKTAGSGMETTASYIPEPARPRNSSNNQTAAKLPIFVGDEIVTDQAKDMLMNLGSNHTTHTLTRPGRATLRDPPRLQTSFTPGLSVIDTSSSASSMETPPAEACQTTAPRQRLLGVYQSFAQRLEDWKNMPGTSAQSTSGDPQDNRAGGHDRQALDCHQHPNRLPVVNDKTGKAVNPARYPYLKPLDTTCMPDGWAVISPKRKARLQGKSSAPNSYAAAAQMSLQNEAAKDEGGLPPPKRQRRNASLPCHTVVTHDSPTAGRLSPPSAASMITDFPYPLAKIDKPVEEEGMLKFDITWKPVFVSFAQIRGQPAAAEKLAVNLPTFAASKSCYDTRMDTVVPEAATTFSIETFKGWEMVLHNGEITLLLEVCFPNSLVEFKDLNGAETMNEARKIVVEKFGKVEGNRLLRIQPSR